MSQSQSWNSKVYVSLSGQMQMAALLIAYQFLFSHTCIIYLMGYFTSQVLSATEEVISKHKMNTPANPEMTVVVAGVMEVINKKP